MNGSDNPNNKNVHAGSSISFTIGKQINLYYPPILIIVGTIGNVLSFAVYAMKKYKGKPIAMYIKVLSVLDTIMLIVGMLQYWLLFNFFPASLSESHCHGMFFVVNFFGNYSHWLIVVLTVDRFVSVVLPHKTYFSPRRIKQVIFFIAVIALIKNFHYMWTTDYVFNRKRGVAMCAYGLISKGADVTGYQWFDMCISSIIPFAIIISLNICIFIALKKRDSIREKSSKVNSVSALAKRNLTIMLLVVSSVFVILTAPLFVFRLYFSMINVAKYSKLTASYFITHHICHKLWYTNNGVNFFLYCMLRKRFRDDLSGIIRKMAAKGVVSVDSCEIVTLSSTKKNNLTSV